MAPLFAVPIGRFRHYKGGTYWLLAVAKHSETGEEMAVYESDADQMLYVRPMSMWAEMVTWPDGIQGPRFLQMGD